MRMGYRDVPRDEARELLKPLSETYGLAKGRGTHGKVRTPFPDGRLWRALSKSVGNSPFDTRRVETKIRCRASHQDDARRAGPMKILRNDL